MSSTLVLNRNYCAIHVQKWEKAITLLYTGAAHAVDENLVSYDFNDWCELSKQMEKNDRGFVNSATLKVAIPEVIRLTRYDKLPRQEVTFTRHNIYEHYKYKCCYCSDRMPTNDLNLDHVIPRALGGPTNWDNIVLSCMPCNMIKGDSPLGQVHYPSASRMRELGCERIVRLAGEKMKLLVHPSRPQWRTMKSLVTKSPVAIPVSWQRLIDEKYWQTELED